MKKKEAYVPESLSRKRLESDGPPRPYDIDKIPEPTHPSRRVRTTNLLATLSLLLIALGVILFLGWSFQSTNVLEVKNSPFPTRSVRNGAEQDGVIILTIDYCKNTKLQGEVRTSFVSKTREVFLPLAKEQYQSGCKRIDVPVLIPRDLPADDYKLKFIARYDVNPLKQQVPIVFESQTFRVNPMGEDTYDIVAPN